jgi:hypothetical protein
MYMYVYLWEEDPTRHAHAGLLAYCFYYYLYV